MFSKLNLKETINVSTRSGQFDGNVPLGKTILLENEDTKTPPHQFRVEKFCKLC